MNPHPKPAVHHNEAYRKFVREHPCAVCGASDVDCHHLAGKENDFATVPLCRADHTKFHLWGLNGIEARYRLNLWRDVFGLMLEWALKGGIFGSGDSDCHCRNTNKTRGLRLARSTSGGKASSAGGEPKTKRGGRHLGNLAGSSVGGGSQNTDGDTLPGAGGLSLKVS